jgi:transposase InsO family protein
MIGDIHQATGQGIRRICATLDVPRSSYYHASAPTPMQSSDEAIGVEIEGIFKRHRRRYGYRRIRDQLADQGIVCAPARVRRIMHERGLKAIQPKTYVPRTSDGRADKPSPNLLLDQPLPEKPNRVWAGDITFIPTAAGWIYLAVVIDLCSRKIVGWALADHLRTELVSDALKQALGSRDTVPDLIFHSDRGSQYGSGAYRQMLSRAGMRQSMSARANPYHNAWTESFMGTLKSEMLQDGCFVNATDARTEIFDYIESYYNHHRKHSSLGYQTPAQFEAKIHSLN